LGSRIPGFRGTSEVTKNNKESKKAVGENNSKDEDFDQF
jgi:hypothetical protein